MTASAGLHIVFVTTALNYPGFRQRVDALRQLGADVLAIGFDQSFPYSVPSQSGKTRGFDSTKPFGVITAGHYGRRAVQLARLVPKVRTSIGSADVVIAAGFDAAVLVRLASLGIKRKTIVYEIHDIRQAMLRADHVGWAMRFIERWVLRRVLVLVVTAEGYLTQYYRKILRSNVEGIVLENKVWMRERGNRIPMPRGEPPLRIGYFGSLRCTQAWRALTRVARCSEGSVEIHVRGAPSGLATFHQDLAAITGMKYGGTYVDPDDLEDLHRGIHLIWAAGFHGKDSYVWARSRRFYAACRFQRPIIAQVETEEGALVEQLGIGLCVDIRNLEATVTTVLRISFDQLSVWAENLSQLPQQVYAYSDEHERLLKRLGEIAEQV